MSRQDLFAYGTLLFDEVMAAVAGRTGESLEAVLDGYERRILRGAVFPGMVARPGGRVRGRLWLDLGPGELERIDRFEGTLYDRRRVQVLAGGARRPAHAYVVSRGHSWMMTDRPWEPEAFRSRSLAGYARRAGDG